MNLVDIDKLIEQREKDLKTIAEKINSGYLNKKPTKEIKEND